MEGNFVSGPASAGFQDSSTVPPVTVKIPSRRGGFPAVAADANLAGNNDSKNGNDSTAPVLRNMVLREIGFMALNFLLQGFAYLGLKKDFASFLQLVLSVLKRIALHYFEYKR
jgi:hypothetical protein